MPHPYAPGVRRIGMIVPSSSTTMETEIPAMPDAWEAIRPERFTFHASRMRMKHVNPEELKAMLGLDPVVPDAGWLVAE